MHDRAECPAFAQTSQALAAVLAVSVLPEPSPTHFALTLLIMDTQTRVDEKDTYALNLIELRRHPSLFSIAS